MLYSATVSSAGRRGFGVSGKSRTTGLIAVCSAAALLLACAPRFSREALETRHVYAYPYAEVWEALRELIVEDLHCAPKKISKKKGYLETDWVHRIDTEGTVRWQIRASARKKSDGVLVVIEKRSQLRDESSRKLSRYRKEQQEDNTSNSGWAKARADLDAIADYHRSLTAKLTP